MITRTPMQMYILGIFAALSLLLPTIIFAEPLSPSAPRQPLPPILPDKPLKPALPLIGTGPSESTTTDHSGSRGTSEGMVTLRFDDGWLSQYENAVPKMNVANIDGTFYIVSQQISDNGFSGFMSRNQIRDLSSQGHEIGAHTRTHTDLTTLSSAAQRREIAGSREDIRNWGGTGPVLSFAYPFGAYTDTTMRLVRDAGFTSAAASIDGFVTSDQYQLERQGVDADVSIAKVREWIDAADRNDDWLILTIHRVEDACGSDQFCTTTRTFDQIVDYLVENGIRTVTVSEGIQSLQ